MACTEAAVVKPALLSGLGGSRDGGGREVDADVWPSAGPMTVRRIRIGVCLRVTADLAGRDQRCQLRLRVSPMFHGGGPSKGALLTVGAV